MAFLKFSYFFAKLVTLAKLKIQEHTITIIKQ